jgi:hypothetical protein
VGVIEPRIAGPHRILVAAEQRQAVLDEGVQGLQGLRPRHRPGKALQLSRMLGEALLDQGNHLTRHGVGLEAAARRQRTRAYGAKGLAVFGIEVPLAAERHVLPMRVHQHPVPFASLAVEVLHA